MADSKQKTSNPLAQTASPSRELAVSRRDLSSSQSNHAGMPFNCMLDERSISSGGSIQAVRPLSLAVVRLNDSAGLKRDSRPQPTAPHSPHGSAPTGNPKSGPRAGLSALES